MVDFDYRYGYGRQKRAPWRSNRALKFSAKFALIFALALMQLSCASGDGTSITVDIPDGTITVPTDGGAVEESTLEPPADLEPLEE